MIASFKREEWHVPALSFKPSAFEITGGHSVAVTARH